jgi:Ca2+-binding EF-hand superfamily protein
MEARAGIEPANRGFAVPGITTLLPRHQAKRRKVLTTKSSRKQKPCSVSPNYYRYSIPGYRCKIINQPTITMKKISGILLFVSFILCLSAAPDGKKKSAGEGKGFSSREEMMKKFDKDGDGKLNEEERAAVREEMKGRKDELLKKFDADGDGKLSDAEREKIRKQLPGKGRKLPPPILAKFDKDGDGELNDEERAVAKKAWEARKEEALEKFDADGDGKLNPQERRAAMKAFQQKGELENESSEPADSAERKKKGGKKGKVGKGKKGGKDKKGKAKKGDKKKDKKKDS